MTTATEVLETGHQIVSWVDDVCEHGSRSGVALPAAIDGLYRALIMPAREHPKVRADWQGVLATLARHTHPSGAYEGRLAQLKADAAVLAEAAR